MSASVPSTTTSEFFEAVSGNVPKSKHFQHITREESVKRPHRRLWRCFGGAKVFIPMQAKVENPRLALVYTLFMCCSVAMILGKIFLLNDACVDAHFRDNEVFSNLQLAPREWDMIQAASDKTLGSHLCQNPEDFQYISSQLSFQNITCTEPCGRGILNASCQHEHQVSAVESASQLFIFSQRAVFTAPDWKHANAQVYTGLEGLAVDVNYGYGFIEKDDFPFGLRRAASGVSRSDMATVVRDIKRKVWRVIGPPNPVKLKITELVELAGMGGALAEGYNPHAADNLFASPNGDAGLLWRLSGMHLTIKVKCSISLFSRARAYFLGYGGHIPCDLSVSEAGQPYSSHIDTTMDPVMQTGAMYYGVRITLAVAGRHCYFTWDNFVQLLAGLTVFIMVPTFLVRWMALYTLGISSEIYTRVLNPLFHIREQIGSAAMRFLINSFFFEELESVDLRGYGTGISGQRFRERLARFLGGRDRQISDLELMSFSDFVFWVIAELPWRSGAHKDEPDAMKLVDTIHPFANAFDVVVSSLTGTDGSVTDSTNVVAMHSSLKPMSPALSDLTRDLRITREAFLQACSSQDAVSFANVLEFFNTDRRTGWLETIFSPSYVRSFMEQGKFDALGSVDGNASHDEAAAAVLGAASFTHVTDEMRQTPSKEMDKKSSAKAQKEFVPLVRKRLLVSVPVVEKLRQSANEGLQVIRSIPSRQNVYEVKEKCATMALFIHAGAASENQQLRKKVNQLDTKLDNAETAVMQAFEAERLKGNLRSSLAE